MTRDLSLAKEIRRQVAGDQSGDRSPHSKKGAIVVSNTIELTIDAEAILQD
jgi:hypothetical protein